MSATFLSGQEFGLRAPSVKWMQIDTDTARIIFPEGNDSIAHQVADYIHDMARTYPSADTAKRIWKVNILLQDATDVTNGYVAYAPFRSEFYLAPGRDNFQLGTIPWHQLLALHEYRHVQQGYAGFRGWSKVMYILFGQEAYSGALHLSVPDWFLEGDAVAAETELSPQGRGRLASFYDGFREKSQTDEHWKYEKLRNGSYREWLPSHYPLGYLLITYGNEKYGAKLWDTIFQEATAYQQLFYPFSEGMKLHTGYGTREFYKEAMDHYSRRWSRELSNENTIEMEVDFKGDYLSFHTPAISEKGEILVLGERFDQNTAMYSVGQGGELTKICRVGLQHEPAFSYAGGKFCWAEIRTHPRWERKDYSVIVTYERETHRKKQITQHTHAYMPAISPDGARIVFAERTSDLNYRLVVLDSESGREMLSFANPEEYVYSFPAWSPDQTKVVVTARDESGRCLLVSYDLESQQGEILADFGFDPIGRPSVTEDWILFSHDREYANAVLGYHRKTGDIHILSNSAYALYDPAMGMQNEEIICTGFTLQGRRLFKIPVNRYSAPKIYDDGIQQPAEKESDLSPASIEPGYYPVKKYPALSRPFNIHTWRIEYDDPVSSFTVKSTNVLQSVNLEGGYRYNSNDESHGPFAELTFSYLFPEILAGYGGTRVTRTIQQQQFRWFQHNLYGGLSIPLQFVSGQSFIDIISTGYLQRLNTDGDLDFSFTSTQGNFRFAHRRARARQHTISRFGQWLSLRYLSDLDTLHAEQFSIETDFTFPGPFRNHIVWLQLDYKKEDQQNDFIFSDVFNYARGYPQVVANALYRAGFNYHAPILYPDFGLFGIAYWKRLGLTVFYDHNVAKTGEQETTFRSAGMEAIFDVRLFNVEDVQFGVRWAHPLDRDVVVGVSNNTFEFFIPFERL